MSTRCTISFRDETGIFTIYQHYDGYPHGESGTIGNLAAMFAGHRGAKVWPFPRFEADEAAAGYVATYKTGAGNIRIVGHGPQAWRNVPDAAYDYLVSHDGIRIVVTVYERRGDGLKRDPIFSGTLAAALHYFETV